jgi:hypothetical protein
MRPRLISNKRKRKLQKRGEYIFWDADNQSWAWYIETAYKPEYNEQEFRQMVEKGTKTWADVPDPGKWLEYLRGH